jgi:hypothetical protein
MSFSEELSVGEKTTPSLHTKRREPQTISRFISNDLTNLNSEPSDLFIVTGAYIDLRPRNIENWCSYRDIFTKCNLNCRLYKGSQEGIDLVDDIEWQILNLMN